MRAVLLVLLLLTALSFATGCSEPVPGPDFDIEGRITGITTRGGDHLPGTILVEGSGRYDRASVRITGATLIEREGRAGRLSFRDLSEGDSVAVLFTGTPSRQRPGG